MSNVVENGAVIRNCLDQAADLLLEGDDSARALTVSELAMVAAMVFPPAQEVPVTECPATVEGCIAQAVQALDDLDELPRGELSTVFVVDLADLARELGVSAVD